MQIYVINNVYKITYVKIKKQKEENGCYFTFITIFRKCNTMWSSSDFCTISTLSTPPCATYYLSRPMQPSITCSGTPTLPQKIPTKFCFSSYNRVYRAFLYCYAVIRYTVYTTYATTSKAPSQRVITLLPPKRVTKYISNEEAMST